MTNLRERSQREARRLAGILDELLKNSKHSKRSVEKRLGLSRGYLSQLLGGQVELKMLHVFALLEILDAEVCLFFELAFPPWQALALKDPKDEKPNPRVTLKAAIWLVQDTVERLERIEGALGELGAFAALEARRAEDEA